MTDDVAARARAAHARRWEVPGPAYRDPVPTGVVELGDWASEYLPELLAEVEKLRDELAENTGIVNALRRQRDTAEAEVERLRAGG